MGENHVFVGRETSCTSTRSTLGPWGRVGMSHRAAEAVRHLPGWVPAPGLLRRRMPVSRPDGTTRAPTAG